MVHAFAQTLTWFKSFELHLLQYLLLQYNTIIMANREYQYIAYCNILQYIARYCVAFSRLKNKMTNKCIKVTISACL